VRARRGAGGRAQRARGAGEREGGGVILLATILQAAGDPAVHSAAEERFRLWGAYSLADPWFLVLVPIRLLARPRRRAGPGGAGGAVPALLPAARRRSIAQRLAWVPTALQASAIVLVAVALARPLRGSVETSTHTEGVDIALAIDISSSMEAHDL